MADNVKPFTRAPDKYESMLKGAYQFDADLNEAIKKAVLSGIPHAMLVGVMFRSLMDIESGIGVIVDGDEPA